MLKLPVLKIFTQKLNELGRKKKPFLFLVDYEMQAPRVWEMDQIDQAEMLYDINGVSNFDAFAAPSNDNVFFEKFPISFTEYQLAFDKVQRAIRRGDTYLANLTFATKVLTSLSLRDIIERARAPYRFYWKDKCAFFSPTKYRNICY